MIFHVDGDAFFASCEIAKNPALRGKPVVTGKERGIVSSASYEAKRLGISRAIPLSQVRLICPDAIILSSDYETYQMYSKRMYAIARRYSPLVEEYGIDECFGTILSEEAARQMQADLERELNITFSVGLGPTKVLAKLGSKWQKPNGFTVVTLENAPSFLAKTPLLRVWGIGSNTALYLEKQGMRTALDFAKKPEYWVRESLAKPLVELWQELNGVSVMPLATGPGDAPHSIQVTRTFTPPRSEEVYLRSQLSKHIEAACGKARRQHLAACEISFFLKTQSFEYLHIHLKLARPTNAPQDILPPVLEAFPKIFRKGRRYRATGITLFGLQDAREVQLDLFHTEAKHNRLTELYKKVDELTLRYGKGLVYLGSSAMTNAPERNARRRLPLPYLGEVS